MCHIAVLKHTLNTDLSPLTYTVHFIVVYTNIAILTIHITLFLKKVFQRTSETDIINTIGGPIPCVVSCRDQ